MVHQAISRLGILVVMGDHCVADPVGIMQYSVCSCSRPCTIRIFLSGSTLFNYNELNHHPALDNKDDKVEKRNVSCGWCWNIRFLSLPLIRMVHNTPTLCCVATLHLLSATCMAIVITSIDSTRGPWQHSFVHHSYLTTISHSTSSLLHEPWQQASAQNCHSSPLVPLLSPYSALYRINLSLNSIALSPSIANNP